VCVGKAQWVVAASEATSLLADNPALWAQLTEEDVTVLASITERILDLVTGEIVDKVPSSPEPG
jgi:hypothetical protein